MFIAIPFILILFSSTAVFFIVYRKWSLIKEAAVSMDSGPPRSPNSPDPKLWKRLAGLWNDFFPEISSWFKRIKIEEYKTAWLFELEKILRRLRVFSLKMDRLSDALIKKIRRSGELTVRESADNRESVQPSAPETVAVRPDVVSWPKEPAENKKIKRKIKKKIDANALKAEEQKLIMEIAKNPKDYRLYESLGDLYFQLGDFDDAKASYEAAVELNPNSDLLAQKRSQTLEKMVK